MPGTAGCLQNVLKNITLMWFFRVKGWQNTRRVGVVLKYRGKGPSWVGVIWFFTITHSKLPTGTPEIQLLTPFGTVSV